MRLIADDFGTKPREPWVGFASDLEKEARKVWPGAMVTLYADHHIGPHLIVQTPLGKTLVAAYARRSDAPLITDLQYLSPDRSGIDRVLEVMRKGLRVAPGAADGAFDLRSGYSSGMSEPRYFIDIGYDTVDNINTLAEAKKTARTLIADFATDAAVVIDRKNGPLGVFVVKRYEGDRGPRVLNIEGREADDWWRSWMARDPHAKKGRASGRSSLRAMMNERTKNPHFYLADERGYVFCTDNALHLASLVGADGGGYTPMKWKTKRGAENFAKGFRVPLHAVFSEYDP